MTVINVCKVLIGKTKNCTITHPHRKTLKWTEDFVTFLLRVDTLNSFILLKKYTTT